MASNRYTGGTLHNIWHPTLNRNILCDVRTNGGGWIVIQRRTSSSVNFNRNWIDYRDGFRSHISNFWLGNEAIYQLITRDSYELRIDLKTRTNFGDVSVYSLYSSFTLGSESQKYHSSTQEPKEL
ncbi:hypothetical protein RRG08_005248 [Elysia crispata]|uniref:Fibrinogen C-terminal domain-containing protein n=1 Tax=Elysia crispata TaxID=231223 RepID=A0AAE0YCM8_9GAST|nr:hypothetical protein RRG08_005248 [Elysia crispata]